MLTLLPLDRILLVGKTPLLVVLGAHLSGATSQSSPVVLAAVLSSALWLFLYAFNEATDAHLERSSTTPRWTLAILSLSPLLISALAIALSRTSAVPFIAMTMGQLVYSLPPLRLKRYWWFIVLISGIANPLLRFGCGAILGDRPVPTLAYAAVILVHLGGAVRTRLLRRNRDRLFGYFPAPDWMKHVGLVSAILGVAVWLLMCLIGIIPLQLLPIVVVGLTYTVYAWSGKTTDMAVLRRGWAIFAPLAVVAIALLWR